MTETNTLCEQLEPMKCKCLYWARTSGEMLIPGHHPKCDGTGQHQEYFRPVADIEQAASDVEDVAFEKADTIFFGDVDQLHKFNRFQLAQYILWGMNWQRQQIAQRTAELEAKFHPDDVMLSPGMSWKCRWETMKQDRDAYRIENAELEKRVKEPIDVVLFCPRCKFQHIDKAEPNTCQECGGPQHEPNDGICRAFVPWLNPPHKSHRCLNCNIVWRPADVPTNGVECAKTVGSNDTELSQSQED